MAGQVTSSAVPAATLHLARRLQGGRVDVSVSDPLARTPLAWDASAFDVPDLLTEKKTVEFLRAVFGRKIGGAKLGECALRNRALKVGDKYVRSVLKAAAQNGQFERQMKSCDKPRFRRV